MISRDATLPEVAAIVVAHLKKHGIEAVVVGGSAVTVHLPDVYTSYDIDFGVLTGVDRRILRRLLKEIGFEERGRAFAHPQCTYTLDFVADTPYIDQRQVREFAEVQTPAGPVPVYRIEDAIADRLAAFLHWNDAQSLDVAVRVVNATRESLDWNLLEKLLGQFDAEDTVTRQRLEFASRKIRAAFP